MKMAHIQEIVARRYGLTRLQLLERTHKHKIARPRQLAVALCREFTGYTWARVGRAFGGYDHATLIHAARRAREDPELEVLRQALRAEIYAQTWLSCGGH